MNTQPYNEQNELGKKEILPLFIKYALPSIGTMLIITIYVVIDGIFISRGIGEVALGAVNLVIPVPIFGYALVAATAVAAGIMISINLGQKKQKEATRIFATLNGINTLISIVIMGVGFLFTPQLVDLLGATNETHQYAVDYLTVTLYFLFFMALQENFAIIVRNDGNPNLSLYGILIGAALNIPFDYLAIFVFEWGVQGAALATGLSQVIGCLVLTTHFFSKKRQVQLSIFRIDFRIAKKIFASSVSIFLSSVGLSLTILLMNILASKFFGTMGLAAFGVITFLTMILDVIFVGISMALQPIISFNHGIGSSHRIKESWVIGAVTSLIMSLVLISILSVFADYFVGVYVTQKMELLDFTVTALIIFLPRYIFMGINMVNLIYLQSIEEHKKATILSIIRIALLIPLAYGLPLLFGDSGIWAVIGAAELLALLITPLLLNRQNQQSFLQTGAE